MENYTDSLIKDFQDTSNQLYYKLLKLKKDFDEQTIIKNGETYIPHALEAEFFSLLKENRQELVSPKLFSLTKEINDLVYYVLTNVEVDDTRSLKNGQTTYNASAVTEYGLHKNYGWSYGGGGSLDHEYQHTGKGIGAPDFELTAPFELDIFVKGQGPQTIVLPTGTTIDAKDYMTRATMDDAFNANINGKLGHHGNSLFAHIISTNNYYITKNIAGKSIYPVLNFSTKTERRQVSLNVGADGILEVSYFD